MKNLRLFCETNKVQVFQHITPTTFIVDLNDDACEVHLRKFANFFCKHHPQASIMKKSKAVDTFTKALAPLFGALNSNYKKLSTNVLSQPIMMNTFLDKKHDAYIWLLKATIFNRGRGIELFSSLQQLEKFIKEYSDGTFDRNLHLAEEHQL